MPTLRILGLDPGSRHTGFGIIEVERGRCGLLDFGRFSAPAKDPLASRLGRLTAGLEEVLDRWSPACAALETPFQGLNPKSLIVLAQARGALLATLARRSIDIREFSPAEVKGAVSGYGRAGKDQVNRMVREILAIRDRTVSPDASDALAVAICCATRNRHDSFVAGNR